MRFFQKKPIPEQVYEKITVYHPSEEDLRIGILPHHYLSGARIDAFVTFQSKKINFFFMNYYSESSRNADYIDFKCPSIMLGQFSFNDLPFDSTLMGRVDSALQRNYGAHFLNEEVHDMDVEAKSAVWTLDKTLTEQEISGMANYLRSFTRIEDLFVGHINYLNIPESAVKTSSILRPELITFDDGERLDYSLKRRNVIPLIL